MRDQFRHPSQDRPIHLPEQDKLDRGPFVSSLVRTLVRDQRSPDGELTGRQATGFVVGLTGKWGLGKSSILHLLALELGSMDRVIVSLFNPWLFNGRDELLRGFFSGLRDAMGRSKVEHARDLAVALDRYWGAIDLAGQAVAAVVDAHGAAGTATTIWEKFGPKAKAALPEPEALSPEAERKNLEVKLAKHKVAVVVLIDELDRVEDSEVRAVAQLVKAVGDIEGLSYLVAYDADRVTDALGRGEGEHRKTSGAHYLEKIIQLPVPLRPLFSEDVDALLSLSLADYGMNLPAEIATHEQAILDQIKQEITTPRDIKRLVGAYSILNLATRGEISDIDVLAYAWIMVKSPALRDALAADCDRVVSDPSTDETIKRYMKRRDNAQPATPEDELGSFAATHSKLLTLMFPRFGQDAVDREDGTRLYLRRNLIRLLYLGNPPGAISRVELEAIWTLTDPVAFEARLRDLLQAGKLPAFIDRLDDLLPNLAESGDTIFWPALSRVLTRSTDWIKGPIPEQAISRDASDTLARLGMRDKNKAARVKASMEALIEAGDLVIAPGVLRKHMFAHGLTHHGPARNGKVVYNKAETEELLSREIPRYRVAITDRTALRRLPNVEAIFVIGNRDVWDDDLRASFTAQLSGTEALTTASALFVPPGYSSDRSAFEQLFDADAVEREVVSLGDIGDTLDPFIAASFRHFKAILIGKNPHFADEDDEPHASADEVA